MRWLLTALFATAAAFEPCSNPQNYLPNAVISTAYTCADVVNMISQNGVTAATCHDIHASSGKPWKFFVHLTGISCCVGPPSVMCGAPFLPCEDSGDYDQAASTSSMGSCATAVGVLTQMAVTAFDCNNDFMSTGIPLSHYVQDIGLSCCRSGPASHMCGAPYSPCVREADFQADKEPSPGTTCKAIRSMLRMSGFPGSKHCSENVLDVPIQTYVEMLELSCCDVGQVNHACGSPWVPCVDHADFTPNAEVNVGGQSVGHCAGIVSTLNFHKFDDSKCEEELVEGATFTSYVRAVKGNCCGNGQAVASCGDPYSPCISESDFLPDVEVAPGTTCQAIMDNMYVAGFEKRMCDDIFAGNAPYSVYIKMAERVCCGSAWGGKGTCGTSLNPCANPNSFQGTAKIMGTQCASAMAQMYDVPDVFELSCRQCRKPAMPGQSITFMDVLPASQSCCGSSQPADVCDKCREASVTPIAVASAPAAALPSSPVAAASEPEATTTAAPTPAPSNDDEYADMMAELAAMREEMANGNKGSATRSARFTRLCGLAMAAALAWQA